MIIAVRTVGALLILLGAANLAGLLAVDLSMLKSPPAVAIRYALMVVAGVGFLLAYRWAFFVYLGSFVVNWVVFLVVYDGQPVGPIWLSLPIPIVIAALTYFAWDVMKPSSEARPER